MPEITECKYRRLSVLIRLMIIFITCTLLRVPIIAVYTCDAVPRSHEKTV